MLRGSRNMKRHLKASHFRLSPLMTKGHQTGRLIQPAQQGLVPRRVKHARRQGHNKDVDPAESHAKIPTHPALNYWAINRKLEKLEQDYKRDQEKKPAEIEFSPVGNPRVAAVVWRVERLKQYVEEIKTAYETEIEAGRFADTPDLWAAVYAQKIVPSATANISSLLWHLGHNLWLTNGGGPGERASIEEAQRELSRLRARLESELANATSHAEEARVEKLQEASMKVATGEAQVEQALGRVSSSPSRISKLRSPLKRAVYAYLLENRDVSDKDILQWLINSNPKVIPARWNSDVSLAGKLFTKVRKLENSSRSSPTHHETLSTAITRQQSRR
jgi:hypothetical protein